MTPAYAVICRFTLCLAVITIQHRYTVMLAVCRELKTSKRTSSVRHLAGMDGRPKHAPRCRSLGVYDGSRTLNARPAGFHVNRAPNLTLNCMPCTVRDAATRADVRRAVPPRTCTSRRLWLHVACLLACRRRRLHDLPSRSRADNRLAHSV